MKKQVIVVWMCMVLWVCVAGVNASNNVNWNGTGNWMDQSKWTDVSPTPDWAIPGWVGNAVDGWNPYNTSHSTAFDWNKGVAVIQSGTVSITSASKPDGKIQEYQVGAGGTSALNISADMTAYRATVGTSSGNLGTITQTAGNSVIEYITYLGYNGGGVYNLQGGSLSLLGEARFGYNSGSTAVFNQTGGSLTASSANTYLGYFAGAAGTINLSGTGGSTSTMNITGKLYLGRSGQGVMNIHNGGSATVGGNVYVGSYGTGAINIDGGSLTSTGWAITIADNGNSTGSVNQSGGTVKAERIQMASLSTLPGAYTISGGMLDITNCLWGKKNSVFKVSGSDATSIEMNQLGSADTGYAMTLSVELDELGSTLIEVLGTTSDSYYGTYLANCTLEVNTLAGFDAGTTIYDILWSREAIDVTGLTFSNLSSTMFDYRVVDATVYGYDSGQLLQLVVPEPATLVLLTGGVLLAFQRRRRG